MGRIYADLLIAGEKVWADIPTKNNTQTKVLVVLKQDVVDGRLTPERFKEITGQDYVA